jgi:hypothetical protein
MNKVLKSIPDLKKHHLFLPLQDLLWLVAKRKAMFSWVQNTICNILAEKSNDRQVFDSVRILKMKLYFFIDRCFSLAPAKN